MKRAIPLLWIAFAGSLLMVLGIVIVLDTFLIDVKENTISYRTLLLAQEQPIVPWLVGVGMGGLACHFWWRNRPAK